MLPLRREPTSVAFLVELPETGCFTPADVQIAMSQQSDTGSQPSENTGGQQPVCPICGGQLIEIRAKLQCSRCHAILETCCEGGRQ